MTIHDVWSAHELDLHEQTWLEAQHNFIEFYNDWLQGAGGGAARCRGRHPRLRFAGTRGVLRKRLQSFLAEQAGQGRLEFIPGEYVDSNLGHTVVRPIVPLPVARTSCSPKRCWPTVSAPRSLSKICGKFRRHGEPTVKAAIDSLVKQRRLRLIGKGSRKAYEAF